MSKPKNTKDLAGVPLRDQVLSVLAALKTPLGPAKLGIKNPDDMSQAFGELQIVSIIAAVDELKRIADLLEKAFGTISAKDLKDMYDRVKEMKKNA